MPVQNHAIVSFHGGRRYYHEAADQLRADCDRLNLRHDLRAMDDVDGLEWHQICRRKIGFLRDMLACHPDGVLWIDIDARLLRRPDPLLHSGADFGAFLTGSGRLQDHDPATGDPLFMAGCLFFSGSDKAARLLSHIHDLEQASDARATDAYFIEQGFRSFAEPLGVHIFDAALAVHGDQPPTARTCVQFSRSRRWHNPVDAAADRTALVESRRQVALLRDFAAQASDDRRPADAIAFLSQGLRLDPANVEIGARLGQIHLNRGDPGQAMRIAKQVDPRLEQLDIAKLFVEASFDLDQYERAAPVLRRLQAKGGKSAAFAASGLVRVAAEQRARDMGLPVADRPPLWWMESPFPGNFGDILNPYLVEKLSGIPPVRVRRGPRIIAIGSIVKFAKPGTIVWGSGTPRMTDRLAADADYRSVRGPLTRDLVLRSGGKVDPIYGDPALLMPLIHQPAKAPKKHRVGLILHQIHLNNPPRIDGVHIISPNRVGHEEIEAFIDEVASCAHIVSTSLHGLVIAHAYGIPARWAVMGADEPQVAGDGTKFHDHHLSVGIDPRPPLDLSTWTGGDIALECTDRIGRWPSLVQLLDAAPFPILPEYRQRAADHDAAMAGLVEKVALSEQVQTLFDALRSAMVQHDRVAVTRLCHDPVVAEMPPVHFFKWITALLRHHHFAIAADLLLRHEQHHRHHRMFAAIRDVRRLVKEVTPDDPVIDRMTRLHDAIFGDALPEPQPTPYAFDPLPDFPESRWGTVVACLSPQAKPVHLDRLHADMEIFKQGMRDASDQPVVEYADVFIDRYGQVWNEAGCFAINAKKPITTVDRTAVPQIDLAMRGVVATSGLYHWMVNFMPTIAWMLRDGVDERLPILLKAGGPDFEVAALELAGFGRDRLAFLSDTLFVKRLISSPIGMRHLRGWAHVRPVFDRMIANAQAKLDGRPTPKLVYVSRTDAHRRPLRNEIALQAALAERGFAICVLSQMPLWEQAALFHGAELIVGPHGAGLANMVFARPGTHVVELLPIIEGAYRLRFNYLRLSMLRGLHHHAWLEPQAVDSDAWSTDLPQFLRFLDDAMAQAGRMPMPA
ncbi:glycosyltransferase 61 family protein [Sphingobium sp. HBC34]|uniref:Glycosyltransferase 61 family protein n=1 Tax=Sphingobium cyanobacteriorum TaxID=3063954 RepID=A0ABT8ZJE9_9SPHN|nr:glycosyltransferase 61 family protein [Sphingobium sp. HBC34]MDO7834660.1 glycosyltransferase 61 family protein [Sphingobium sp. HBC34]